MVVLNSAIRIFQIRFDSRQRMTFWMAVWASTPIAPIAPPYLHLWVDASVLQSRDLSQDLSRDLSQDLSQDLSRDLSRDLSQDLAARCVGNSESFSRCR